MKKDWILAAVMLLITLGAALGLLRWLAPQLIGVPIDLQMVATSEEVPPYFEHIFREEDFRSKEYLIKDPYAGSRAQPLYPNFMAVGPNDILGFRNFEVPNVADIVILGDSQTYGNNAAINQNWPGYMKEMLSEADPVIYNMSVGGWGAVHYLYMASKATVFQPRVMVVAFYSGNDPLDSFRMAYNYDIWQDLRPDPNLSADDAPQVSMDVEESEKWPVKFKDGIETVFTPTVRYLSNQDHPAVKAGYEIMAESARRIAELVEPQGVSVVYTIIPTKELVYERKILQEGIEINENYQKLVTAEKANIQRLEAALGEIKGSHYLDLVEPLQRAAMTDVMLYPTNINGHPIANGYAKIGAVMANAFAPGIPGPPRGLFLIPIGEQRVPMLIDDKGLWAFDSPELLAQNGWRKEDVKPIGQRWINRLPSAGIIKTVDPQRFGPQAFGVK